MAKKLYRIEENRIIAGVAAGVADYFNIDPIIVRVVFVAAALINGFGLLAYFLIWIMVPNGQPDSAS